MPPMALALPLQGKWRPRYIAILRAGLRVVSKWGAERGCTRHTYDIFHGMVYTISCFSFSIAIQIKISKYRLDQSAKK